MTKFSWIPRSATQLLQVFMLAMALSGCAAKNIADDQPCLERRGAIDIGSGSTKAYAAIVDICVTPKKIVEKLFDSKVKISFGEAVEQSPDGKIPAEMITDASVKIARLADEMNAHHLDSLEAVATAAIRKSKNRDEVVSAISKSIADRLRGKTKIKPEALNVRVLSQIEEAQVGASSALANLPSTDENPAEKSKSVMVWDIGGGSMQMTAPNSDELFTGDLASVSFKNQVIRDVLKKDPHLVKSPNPLKKSAPKATAIARAHAETNVGTYFKNPALRWVGIGGVLALSVQKQVDREEGERRSGPPHFTVKAVSKTLDKRANRTDEEIDSEYRETEITNLALVLGYMQALKIEKVETVEASLVQGLILR